MYKRTRHMARTRVRYEPSKFVRRNEFGGRSCHTAHLLTSTSKLPQPCFERPGNPFVVRATAERANDRCIYCLVCYTHVCNNWVGNICIRISRPACLARAPSCTLPYQPMKYSLKLSLSLNSGRSHRIFTMSSQCTVLTLTPAI